MRKAKFINGCFYHVYNRGVEKRKIFLRKQDYLRFTHGLHEFNAVTPVKNIARLLVRGSTLHKEREVLIEINCFSLMPNHFHLLVKQVKEDGVPKFMQKLGTGYTMYFNLKNERNGSLFGSRFKAVKVETDEQFIHLSRYIHLNCVDLIEPDWKEVGINNWNQVNKFLENYRWSSYLDYIGKQNFPSVIKKDFLMEYFGTVGAYKKFVRDWLVKDKKIDDLILE